MSHSQLGHGHSCPLTKMAETGGVGWSESQGSGPWGSGPCSTSQGYGASTQPPPPPYDRAGHSSRRRSR